MMCPPSDILNQKEAICLTKKNKNCCYYLPCLSTIPVKIGDSCIEMLIVLVIHRTASTAESWCISTQCPAKATDANSGNCCVYHVNVHSCPQEKLDASTLCGPWISASGQSFTHSDVMIGKVSTGIWQSTIAGLYVIGPVSLIAHFKIARLHIALHKLVTVQEAYCE
jgi:hypothetical protein